MGSSEQLNQLIEFLNKLVDSEKAHGATLHALEGALRTRFTELSPALDFAIASRRLHGRCDLVSFF